MPSLPLSAPAAKRTRPAIRDPETLGLMQEKAGLQRQLARVKEEVALLERCLALSEKGDKQVVDGLVAKWQVACSRACEDLFELLKPVMEAQRASAALGFGPAGFDDEKSNSGRAAEPKDEGDGAGDGGDGRSEEGGESEDIDIPYMLKRFGIDPELF
ncbi:hypothetical protein LPJ61_001888 [Coemansia biformis]|uniref:Uncharacterized protein n=1 Tax=Coemansia biformis TaxID=1286918 RepID=A0A9W8CWX4_9FUNG|nr:hypothetical protein LPJ61_001888 [Coemansia biformis]